MKMSIAYELEEMRALQDILDNHTVDLPGDVGKIVVAMTARTRETLEVFERWQPKSRDDRED